MMMLASSAAMLVLQLATVLLLYKNGESSLNKFIFSVDACLTAAPDNSHYFPLYPIYSKLLESFCPFAALVSGRNNQILVTHKQMHS